jgi:hypothetical protein
MKKSQLKQIIREQILNELEPVSANPVYECQPWALKELKSEVSFNYWVDDYDEDTANALVLLDIITRGTKKRFTKKDVKNAFKNTSHYGSLEDMWWTGESNLNNRVNSLIEFFKECNVIK